MSPDSTNWFVAIAQPNAVVEKEHKRLAHESDGEFRTRIAALPPQTVMERLEQAECRVFYPKARIVRQRLLKGSTTPVRETVWEPVFGRYVFASHAEPATIREVRGVSRLVNNADGEPGRVSQDLIEELRRHYRDYKRIIKWSEVSLVKGQKVKLIDGPFRSYDMEVACIKKLYRGLFDAVYEASGRKFRIRDVPVEDVEAVSTTT